MRDKTNDLQREAAEALAKIRSKAEAKRVNIEMMEDEARDNSED